jgi:hypothetical protein
MMATAQMPVAFPPFLLVIAAAMVILTPLDLTVGGGVLLRLEEPTPGTATWTVPPAVYTGATTVCELEALFVVLKIDDFSV